ncbi:MAG: hypothetical protein J6O04_06280 [Selenomonadaceae bacterium]|nr:hypothetical protein [Selenomonadaceae bacterium]
MRKLQLVAIGKTTEEAEEIASIVGSFLESMVPIKIVTTDKVAVEDDCLYIAPSSERGRLKAIPKERLSFFDMHPTDDFFASIRKIPENYPIYVFNGHFSYVNLLRKECKRRGIRRNFFPIAYLDQPKKDVEILLKRAEYIIGIDHKMGMQALFSERYRVFLRGSVKIITGRRAASANSAGKLLGKIAAYHEKKMKEELNRIKILHEQGEDVEVLTDALFNRIFDVAVHLSNANCLINANEGKNSYDDDLFLEDDGLELTGDIEDDFLRINARMLNFELLRQRIQFLSRS